MIKKILFQKVYCEIQRNNHYRPMFLNSILKFCQQHPAFIIFMMQRKNNLCRKSDQYPSRVNSHFSNNSETRQKQNFITHIHSISFKSCATELMASILESVEIKKYWPKFNYSQKHWEDVFGIYTYEDRNGFLRLIIEKNKKNLKPVHSFHNLSEGYTWLRTIIEEYKLCPKLCFLEKGNGQCTGVENKTCKGACIKQESSSFL
jgi:hypothetical protein